MQWTSTKAFASCCAAVFLALSGETAQALDGDFAWAQGMGSSNGSPAPSNDLGIAVAVDTDGNVYTTGYFRGTADFDPNNTGTNPSDTLTSVGSADIFVSKFDINGIFIWAVAMGGAGDTASYQDSGRSIALDAAGNVYTTGIFTGTVDFDPTNQTAMQTSLGLSDIYVSKLDTNGNFVWAQRMGGLGKDNGQGIAVDRQARASCEIL